MARIRCVECEHMFNMNLSACPKCGCLSRYSQRNREELFDDEKSTSYYADISEHDCYPDREDPENITPTQRPAASLSKDNAPYRAPMHQWVQNPPKIPYTFQKDPIFKNSGLGIAVLVVVFLFIFMIVAIEIFSLGTTSVSPLSWVQTSAQAIKMLAVNMNLPLL